MKFPPGSSRAAARVAMLMPSGMYAGLIVDLKLKNNSARVELECGRANARHIGIILSMASMSRHLAAIGVGRELAERIDTARRCAIDIENRGPGACGTYFASTEEIEKLFDLNCIHDSQIDNSRAGDIETALLMARAEAAAAEIAQAGRAQAAAHPNQ